MRPVPFRVVFLLGLGEGLFPAPHRRDPLDLRSRRRRAGDVTPAERDRYTFLETLLSTRERLWISWVDRDATSGENLLPSSVVQQLQRILDEGYVEDLDASVLSRRSLRRHHEVPLLRPERSSEPIVASAEAVEEARARALGRPFRELDRAAELLQALPELAGPEASALRSLLRMQPLERPDVGPEERRVDLSLSSLWKFLLSPLQTWGAVVAGLGDTEDDLLDRSDAEPTETSRLLSATLPRRAFLDEVCSGSDGRATLAALLRRHQLAGDLPSGALGELTLEILQEDLERWFSLRDGNLAGRAFLRPRVGRAFEGDRFERLLPAIELVLDLPAGPARVRLHGRLEALSCDGLSTLMARERSAERVDPDPPRSRRARWGLQAIFEHFVLAAAGEVSGCERHLDLLVARAEGSSGPPEPRFYRLGLRPVERETARATLRVLATDLLSRPHTYLLPGEAVLSLGLRGLSNGEKLVAEVERRVGQRQRGEWSCRHGVVPAPETYPPPAPDEAAAMAERRFRTLLDHQGPWGQVP
jgi:exodeoxyribonuclease V gamma subunit